MERLISEEVRYPGGGGGKVDGPVGFRISYAVGTTRTLRYELNPLLLNFLKVSSSFENLMEAGLIFRRKYTYITNLYIILWARGPPWTLGRGL